MHEGLGAGQGVEPMRGGAAAVSVLRRAYFAHAAEAAIRYDVAFERLLQHLRAARQHRPHLSLYAVAHVDDLVHAVACVDGLDLAWWDLVERHERALVRACRRWLEETDAVLVVRRLLSRLRRGDDDRVPSLHSFDGTTSMRRWLGDRLTGVLSRGGIDPGTPTRPRPTWQPIILWNSRADGSQPAAAGCVRGDYAWPAPLGRSGPYPWAPSALRADPG